jgi:hypothetical protein
MGLGDQLTVTRVAAVPVVVVLFLCGLRGRLLRPRRAGRSSEDVAWWSLLVALVLTLVSGPDYARVAPGLLRWRAVAQP